MAALWKDTTSYSRDDKEHKPTTWSLTLGKLRVSIVSEHIYYKGQWVMHCEPFYDTYPLGGSVAEMTTEQAQAKALALVRAKVDEVVKALAEAGE